MLQVQNIQFKVGNIHLLKDISFEVTEGEFVAILGPNGAGKSTLLKQVAGQTQIQSGHIFWKGQPLNDICKKVLSKQRAVLTQQTQVAFDFSVESVTMMGRYPHFENIPSEKDHQAVHHCLKSTEMNSYCERSILSLSGGEQQRTHIARVWAQLYSEKQNSLDPKILLLDEPLNNLDIRHQHNILQESAKYAKKGNIVLAVLHDINLAAMYASKILLLKKGQILALGTPEEVLQEDLLSECYDFPARVTMHPFHHSPQVHFGCSVYQSQKI